MDLIQYPLPIPKKFEIKNFDLYKCPINIDFARGLNIVFGTNGLGKSTFLYILQYSIIGPYMDGVKTRNYQGEQKIRRPIYNDDFFRQRMKEQSEKARVKVGFSLGNKKFVVTHSLFDLRLLSVLIDGEKLTGRIISYKKYEEGYFSSKPEEKNSLDQTLIYMYHKSLVEASKLPDIEALITMMTKCMFFTEDREFTFWSDDLSNTIVSKYFMNQAGYKQFIKQQQEVKKLDSQARLKTYEISFIRKFLGENSKSEKGQYSFKDLGQIQEEIEILESTTKVIETHLLRYEKDSVESRIAIENIKNHINSLDAAWYKAIFPDPYKQSFDRYSRSLIEGNCPFCGSKGDFSIKASECFYCGSKIEVSYKANIADIELDKKDAENELSIAERNHTRIQKKISSLQKELYDNNKKFDLLKIKEIKARDSLKRDEKTDENYQKLKSLENEKKVLQNKKNEASRRASDMLKNLDEQVQRNFKEFSYIFDKYALAFFGNEFLTKLELVGDQDEKLFRFYLNGSRRETSKSLSESQRIFVDLAFRLAILDFFHGKSYFICETPDSTLDVYSEQRAERIFTRFIKSGNTLFLSANARSSTLIKELVKKNQNNCNVINLFDISTAASTDETLKKTLHIEEFLEL